MYATERCAITIYSYLLTSKPPTVGSRTGNAVLQTMRIGNGLSRVVSSPFQEKDSGILRSSIKKGKINDVVTLSKLYRIERSQGIAIVQIASVLTTE